MLALADRVEERGDEAAEAALRALPGLVALCLGIDAGAATGRGGA
jgi:hypothetical protein